MKNSPTTAREALIVEALGEAATLIRQVEALAPRLDEYRQALADAHMGLAGQLRTFEAQVLALPENVKVLASKRIQAIIDEATLKSIDLQGRAMKEAARVAFDAELGPALQRVQSVLRQLIERPNRHWEQWMTHLAAATMAAAATWTLALWLLRR